MRTVNFLYNLIRYIGQFLSSAIDFLFSPFGSPKSKTKRLINGQFRTEAKYYFDGLNYGVPKEILGQAQDDAAYIFL